MSSVVLVNFPIHVKLDHILPTRKYEIPFTTNTSTLSQLFLLFALVAAPPKYKTKIVKNHRCEVILN